MKYGSGLEYFLGLCRGFCFSHRDDLETGSDFFFGWKWRTETLISIGLVLETNSCAPGTPNLTEMFIASI
jgi:hypothetical protein